MGTLDDILWNFRNLTMRFLQGNELCELQGNETSSLHMIRANKLSKLLAKKDDVASVQLCNLAVRACPEYNSFFFSAQMT